MGNNVVSFSHIPYLSPLGSWVNTVLVLNQQEASFRMSERAAGLRSSRIQEQLAIHGTASYEEMFGTQYLDGSNRSRI